MKGNIYGNMHNIEKALILMKSGELKQFFQKCVEIDKKTGLLKTETRNKRKYKSRKNKNRKQRKTKKNI